MFAAAKPEPHPRMLDRFLVIAEGNELAARIVINKVELVGEAGGARAFRHVRARRLSGALHERESARSASRRFARRSSVAARCSPDRRASASRRCSTRCFPGANLRVGEISESVNKGRHTTVGALMLPLPDAGADAGYVIDTPGLREVGLWALPVGASRPVLPGDARAARRHVASPTVVTSPSRIARFARRFAPAR